MDMKINKTPQEFGYVVNNNTCLFQKGPLSQWWGAHAGQNSSFTIDNGRGVRSTFNCCEQYMMAAKADWFGDDESYGRIMNEKNPKIQKELGRGVSGFDPVQWDRVKYNVVLDANKYKFEQNEDCREFLLSFNKHTIFAEAAPWDSIWGIGLGPDAAAALDIYKWRGENLLGEAIREVRRWLEKPLRQFEGRSYLHPREFDEE